jgi:hypothetical protein
MQLHTQGIPDNAFPHNKRIVRAWKLCVFALLLLAAMTLSISRAPTAHAGGSAAIIHWDSSMIYPGQNNGFPWGPVGEIANVHGANFSPNLNLHLVVTPGDSNHNASLCQQPVVTVQVGMVTTDASGGFTQNFSWPASAGQVNQGYSICALSASDNSIASSQDDGPFTVLTSSPPVIDLSTTTVTSGGTITVIGHNWVPPQPVSINIAGCAACEPGNTEVTNVSTNSTGLNDGSFSVSVTIPSHTKPGNYVVDALTQSGLEAYYTTGVKHLTITAVAVAPTPSPAPSPSPTPSPSATTSASPTAVPSATATSSTTNTSAGSGNGSSGANGNSSHGPLIIALVIIALILFAIAGGVIFLLMRRSSGKRLTDHDMQPVQNGQFGQYSQIGSPPGNYGQSMPPPGYGQSMPGNVPPQFGQPMQSAGNYPPQYDHDAPTQANTSFGRGAPAPACMNCGRPLMPNSPACNTCGMPTGVR